MNFDPKESIAEENSFKEKLFFNWASIGDVSKEAKKAVEDLEKKPEKKPDEWDKALKRVKTRFSNLLGVKKDEVYVFHNTTAGIQRVFIRIQELLRGERATMLTTDIEYPGIISHVDEIWRGPIAMINVADLIWQGQVDLVLEAIERAVLMTRPAVVYLSHVCRASGYRLDERVLDFIRMVDPRTVVVLDGAQAVGNISIGSEVIQKVDFYITSGHKWLAGKVALGLVYAQEKWRLGDPAQSYSRRVGSGGTGNLDALVSLAKSLNDFLGVSRSQQIESKNAYMAHHFSNLITKMSTDLQPLGSMVGSTWRWNGIVAIPLRDRADEFTERLDSWGKNGQRMSEFLKNNKLKDKYKNSKVQYTHLDDEPWSTGEGGLPPGPRISISAHYRGRNWHLCNYNKLIDFRRVRTPLPKWGVLRFCFHYNHSTEDLEALAHILVKWSP